MARAPGHTVWDIGRPVPQHRAVAPANQRILATSPPRFILQVPGDATRYEAAVTRTGQQTMEALVLPRRLGQQPETVAACGAYRQGASSRETGPPCAR